MAIKTENTMAEGLQSIMTDIATLKLTADADIPFLVQLETQVLGYLRQGMDTANQQPGGGIGGAGGMGGGMGGPGPAGGMPPGMMPAGPMGGRAALNAPNPAPSPGPQFGPQTAPMGEIRRMLS